MWNRVFSYSIAAFQMFFIEDLFSSFCHVKRSKSKHNVFAYSRASFVLTNLHGNSNSITFYQLNHMVLSWHRIKGSSFSLIKTHLAIWLITSTNKHFRMFPSKRPFSKEMKLFHSTIGCYIKAQSHAVSRYYHGWALNNAE